MRKGFDIMKILLSGGGTAGHINPALAVASHFAQADGAEIMFIGTKKGLESRLVPNAGWPIQYIEVSGLIRKLTFKNFLVIKQFLVAIHHAKTILREFEPDVVIGTGGYVCAPVLYAAHALKIPTVIHEQNVIPGVTVKMAAGFCDRICISFPETTNYLKPAYAKKCVLTGNPIRSQLFTVDRALARKQLGLDQRPFVAAFGGSLGAASLNTAIVDMLNHADINQFQLMLGTGQRFYENVCKEIKKKGDNLYILPYIEHMDLVMAAADIVIGRAGALTISELCALGKPAILIPSPNVAHDHQTHNAKSMEQAGSAVVIKDSELTFTHLYHTINKLIQNPAQIAIMSEKAKAIGIVDGAERICAAARNLLSQK